MSVLVNFRIDETLKDNMDRVCKKLGLTMSAAFNMFAKNLVNNKSINFTLNKKLDSGINFQYLFDKMDDAKVPCVDDTVGTVKLVSTNEQYYVNKVGNIIMLVPKNDVWAGLKESAGGMSQDFMAERIQNVDSKREEL